MEDVVDTWMADEVVDEAVDEAVDEVVVEVVDPPSNPETLVLLPLLLERR